MASDEHPEIIEKVEEIEDDRIVLTEVIPEIHIQTASYKMSLEKGEETEHVSQKFVDETTKLDKPTDEEQLTLNAIFQTDSTNVTTDDHTKASEEKENELEITTTEENEDDNDEKQMKIPETKRKGPVSDFVIKKQNTEDLDIFGEPQKVTDYHFESSSESDTSTDVPEIPPIGIDRQVYIEQYKSLNTEKLITKRRNILLQKKLIEYFKKRKVDSIFKEDEPMGLDAEQKYNKRLLEYSALKVEEDKEKQEMNQEISKLRGQKEELATELDNQLKALMTRQTEIGLALKNSKTGKLIPPEKRRTYGVELATQYICTCTQMNAMMTAGLAVEERGVASAALVMGRVVIFLTQITRDKITNDSTQLIVQRLVSRQLNKFKEVGKIRLEYTKLRNHVTAQEELRKSIETFGDDLFLIDYEQLRMENQNFLEKIEERDEELERLRQKATSSIQVLAHVREKADATTSDIHEKVKRLNDTDAEVTFLREQLTSLKRRRDHFRDESQRLRREAGLVNRDKTFGRF
uniref:CCDC113/CCDC96 coiled-coil domain-containing protein n=1 Tax=Timema cristinae TaxID=61476 RepID=A0A7R9CRY9_TIMCR|nr:unnamed protein product [Timema cristinae]